MEIRTILTARFEQAMAYAAQVHTTQLRKGTGVPYIAHLLAVAAIVLENGGDEDTAIAALLHDAAEDQGGRERLEDIRAKFGERVAHYVEGCSDALAAPGERKPAWRQRKESYLAHLAGAPPEVRLISASDKLHNVRSIIADLRCTGGEVWKKFSAGMEGSLWYYRSLSEIFTRLGPAALAAEVARSVHEMEQLAHRRHDEQVAAALGREAGVELGEALVRICHCLEQLSNELIWSRTGEDRNAIGNLILHLCGNLRQWIISGLGGVADIRERPKEFSERGRFPRADLLARLEAVVGEAQAVLAKLDGPELLRVRRIQGFDVSGMAAVFHTVPHFRGHAQEITHMTRTLLGERYRFLWKPATPEQGAPV